MTPCDWWFAMIGRHIAQLLAEHPFDGWAFTRTASAHPSPSTHYEFHEHAVDVTCQADLVRTVVLRRRSDPALAPVPWSTDPQRARALLGPPTARGVASDHPALGSFGPWDRWDLTGGRLHLEYDLDGRSIRLISLASPPVSADVRGHAAR